MYGKTSPLLNLEPWLGAVCECMAGDVSLSKGGGHCVTVEVCGLMLHIYDVYIYVCGNSQYG